MSTSTVHTRTCHLCEANCGVLVELDGADIISIKGDPDHVLSRGHICPKATAIADLQTDPDRLRRPVKKTADGWQEIDWDTAFQEIGARYAALGRPQSALYIGNPTAHNYSVGTQMRGLKKALGVRAVYSASTLDQIPHQLVQMWMYGHNALFPIPDIDRTTHMLIVGGNPLASNGSVWTVPDVKRRIQDLQERGGRLTVVDPRRTETAKIADAHHFIRPGTDPAFFLALLKAADEAGLIDPGRIAPMLDGDWPDILARVRSFDMGRLAGHCGVAEDAIRALAADLAGPEPTIVYGRIGVSTQRWGTLNLWLIQLLNIAFGNLDVPGGVMFSTPAIDIAGSAGRGTYDRFRSRIGDHPECIGEFPTATLADEILTPDESGGDGQVRTLVTIAGNPVLSAPGGERLDAALDSLDLMVSVDMYVSETARHADYILPPCGPLQKDHYPLVLGPLAVRNYACYSPPLLPMGEDELSDWEIVARLAEALGGTANRKTPRETLDAGLRHGPHGLTLEAVEAAPHGIDLGPHEPRLPDRLATPDKRIHTAPPLCLEDLARFRAELATAGDPATLLLIGRRHVRSNNSWLHNSKRLVKGPDRCTVMMHPDDARARNIGEGAAVEVAS
ncbi:MAG: molybdopterin-dependent oxidoreductase, partial [Pseudomonadota bacterium]